MYAGYKVVVNTAAGRRRYMQYLIPFVVADEHVDRYDIWINTHDGADIEFFRQCAARYPKVNLVWQPDGIVGGISTINAFYKACVEEDAIYFKLDDDIVWMEPDLISKMLAFRVANPQYFLVSPMVINNALSSYLLQTEGKIKFHKYYPSECVMSDLTLSGPLACELHEWFIDRWLVPGKYSELYVGAHPMGMIRFSINAILWFGSEMKKFGGVVPGDDEEFMSCIYPCKAGLDNCWNGDALAAHFAFGKQRAFLDGKGILSRYGDYLDGFWGNDPEMKGYRDDMKEIMADIEARQDALSSAPSPYGRPEVPVTEGPVKRFLRKILPAKFVSVLSEMIKPEVKRFIVE